MSQDNLSMKERSSRLEHTFHPAPPHDSKLAPALCATAKQLEMEMKKDAVRSGLSGRMSIEEMEERGLLDTSVAPSLMSRAREVDKEMTKIFLNHQLERRSDSSELEERGILHNPESSVLAGRMVELERNMAKDSLSHSLQSRPGEKELVESGKMMGHQMSAKLQATEKQLTMEMKRRSVEEGLSQRPSPEELKGKLPAVYDSLSEEAKEASVSPSCSPLFRVYTSLILATAKQLALAGRITSSQYDQLVADLQDDEKRALLFKVAETYKRTGEYKPYEEAIIQIL
ncbi:hypothetical protein WA588_002477, partial [Blastocystis sp. NMH]